MKECILPCVEGLSRQSDALRPKRFSTFSKEQSGIQWIPLSSSNSNAPRIGEGTKLVAFIRPGRITAFQKKRSYRFFRQEILECQAPHPAVIASMPLF